ncbi:MAG: hypothetical protein JXB23_04880 [Candidatus Aminicenantes bacterium]|nr:hypothetical protein [Candidatus Aminicenantes bacterium]
MKDFQDKKYSRGLTFLRIFPFLFLFNVLNPAATKAEKNKGMEEKRKAVKAQKIEGSESAADYRKLQIEFYGGYTPISPADFNLFADYEDKIQKFAYDDYFDYLQSQGQILTWSQSQDGQREKIKKAFPLGMRLKYRLNRTYAVSVGFRYISAESDSDIDFQYIRHELFDEQYIEGLMYAPFSLSANAYIPQIGIHIIKTLTKAFTFEGFLAGGPMFVRCSYLSNWNYAWRVQGPGYAYTVINRAGLLEAKGTGIGIALDFGGRLEYAVTKILAVFFEGSYAYQVAKKISGPGFEAQGDMSESWDGRWGIKQEKMTAPWGELEVEFPTNYWPIDSFSNSSRDFELGLSGFQLKLGFAFRF